LLRRQLIRWSGSALVSSYGQADPQNALCLQGFLWESLAIDIKFVPQKSPRKSKTSVDISRFFPTSLSH
jgi:hypothetical protein